MKAMMLTGLRRKEMRTVPDPEIRNDGDVLLKLACVGVCGSDVHYYLRGNIGSQVVKYPFTVGHECSAIVQAVGKSVTRVRPGDRVAVEPAMSCGTCDQCLCGRPHTCRRLRFLGCPGQAEGCLAEYLVMPEACCVPVPPELSLEMAAFVEPMAIGLYAARLAGSLKGARIGILGAGPIGLSVLLSARSLGAQRMYVTDKLEPRLAAAARAGAAWTGMPGAPDPVQAVSSLEPLLLDTVFECCGQQSAMDQAAALLKPGGKLMLIGIPESDRVSLLIDMGRRKELCVQNVRRQCSCVEPAIGLLAGPARDAASLVTHRFPFARTAEAFELVAGYRDGVIKAMIDFGVG